MTMEVFIKTVLQYVCRHTGHTHTYVHSHRAPTSVGVNKLKQRGQGGLCHVRNGISPGPGWGSDRESETEAKEDAIPAPAPKCSDSKCALQEEAASYSGFNALHVRQHVIRPAALGLGTVAHVGTWALSTSGFRGPGAGSSLRVGGLAFVRGNVWHVV